MSISHSASPSYEENSVFNNTGRSKSVTGTEYLQANNNCFEEEEEWQSKLDKWREKRRQALRMEATHLTLLQERENKENERRKEEAKDRLRQVKHQRSLLGCGRISSIELVPSPPIKSPGVALLTGSAFDSPTMNHEESRQVDTISNSQSVSPHNSRLTEDVEHIKSNSSEIEMNGHTNCPSPISEMKAQLLENTSDKEIDISASKNTSVEKPTKRSSVEIIRDPPHNNGSLIPTNESDNQKFIFPPEKKNGDVSVKFEDYSECKLRLSSRHGVSESCWGLTLKAEGPSDTFPFVVERVKIGSSADICEFQKGDILICIDGVNLGINRPNSTKSTKQITKLEDLEKLMAQLAVVTKPITVQVLRKEDEFDDPTFGEPDTVDDYPATSSPHKTAHSPSNLDDSDSECFEVMVSPTSVFPPKTSHLDTPVYHRPVTITHSLHKTPSEGSVHISDDEDDNSSVSSDSEEKNVSVYNCQERNVIVSSISSSNIDRNKHRIVKTYQSEFETEVSNPLEVGTTRLSSPSQSDSVNCNGTSNYKRGAEINYTEPTHFTLATASMLSPCIQTDYQVKLAHEVMEEAKSTKLVNGSKSNDANPTTHISQGNLTNSVPNIAQNFDSSMFTIPSEIILHSSLSPKMKHRSPQRTFHIHPKLPNSTNDIPFHIPSNSRGSFTLKYKQNSLPNPPPSSYFLCNTNLSTTQLDSPKPNVPPRPIISKTSRPSSSQCFSSTISIDSKSAPSLSGEASRLNLNKSDVIKSQLANTIGLDTSMNTAKSCLPPPPPAPLPVTKPQYQSFREETLQNIHLKNNIENGLEKPGNVGKGANSFEKCKTPLPTPPQIYARLEAEVPPLPPRTPRIRVVDLDQLCAACNAKLGFEDSMVIESLNLYYHLPCFVCARCGISLGDGLSDVEVRVRRNLLYCSNCHSKNMNLNDNKHEHDLKTRQQLTCQPPKPPTPTDRRYRHGRNSIVVKASYIDFKV
uniref:LIM zinc-binding domain-containing protein n=1 Tax=Trichobilharzia regenti TaxID=157069 RepID=A0AA85ITR3_TRIRE|nr:unnamed protein product [Trichobilharzia regenti]